MALIPGAQLAAQQAVQSASQTAQGAVGAGRSPNAAPAYQTPFGSLLQQAVQKTQQLESDAANTVGGLLSGQGVDVHTAMIATEKSNLGFEMMLAFRNKAVAAYQQLMGLQF
jgi:flagellar hook-basal body complex protein FliE